MTGGPGWLVAWPTRLSPLVDLICCPGAGAGASAFQKWPQALPGFARVCAVQAPGREGRLEERPASTLAEVAEGAAAAHLAEGGGRPVVLFGHSMGGAVAVEIARRLDAAGRAPRAVILTASAPPSGRGGAALGPEALRALLLAYDPSNAAVVANEEMFAALAPALAADIAMLRAHRAAVEPRLKAEAILLAGAADPVVPAEAVAEWAAFFAGPAEVTRLPGGHHFPFQDSAAAVAKLTAQALRAALRG